jgi:hypothetical protein
MEVSDQLHAPAASPPGKEPLVPTGKEAGWASEPVWTTQDINRSITTLHFTVKMDAAWTSVT